MDVPSSVVASTETTFVHHQTSNLIIDQQSLRFAILCRPTCTFYSIQAGRAEDYDMYYRMYNPMELNALNSGGMDK